MMIFLASFHSIDSYSALQHKRARFQDFADKFARLWSNVAWSQREQVIH